MATSRMAVPQGAIGLWLMFILIFSPALFYCFAKANADYRVSSREARVEGRLTAFHAEDHARFDYSYAIGGHVFAGRGSTATQYPSDQMIGQKVSIFYDPSHPKRSQTYSFSESYRDMIFYALLWVACLVFVIVATRHLRSTHPTATTSG